MIELKGRYAEARVMTDTVDQTTMSQLHAMLNCRAFEGGDIAIMPDCHAGAGCVIGFTMPMRDKIVPNVVGVDIGCGMTSRVYPRDVAAAVVGVLVDFDNHVRAKVPSGFSTRARIHRRAISDGGEEFFDSMTKCCERIGYDVDKALRSIGSLGGGNHFIELGVGGDGALYATVHSGSRGFGMAVAKFYQKVAQQLCFGDGVAKGLEWLDVDSTGGRMYLEDLRLAQFFAHLNRGAILDELDEFLFKLFGKPPVDEIESVHNFVGDDNVIRKGATPACDGQRVLIPFNMRDGMALCVGKGSQKYNNSAPHGAGRIMSRSVAKANLDADEFVKSMADAGVYTTSASRATLDEAPEAYKPMDAILPYISETVDVSTMIRPIYNFKAADF